MLNWENWEHKLLCRSDLVFIFGGSERMRAVDHRRQELEWALDHPPHVTDVELRPRGRK